MAKINLQELISQIRDELETLDRNREAAGKPPLFHLESLELELKFAVAENAGSKGGVDLKVISFGADEAVREEQVQTVRLRYRAAPTTEETPLPGTRAHSTSRNQDTDGTVALE